MSDNIFDYVNKKAPIKDIVSYCLGEKNLIKKGSDYKSVCPFHSDHDPSLSISISKNIAKCFACGHGGTPVNFVMEYYKISPIDAVKKIVEICHLDLPKNFSLNTKVEKKDNKYAVESNALKELADFYSISLNTSEGKDCLNYLKKRNIPEDIIKEFKLGYALKDSSLSIKYLIERGYDIATLQNAGILNNSVANQDRFSNRLIFPLVDENSNIVAFAGRQLDKSDKLGKYVNYSDTLLFHKSDLLFNLDKAKNYIYSSKCLYIVEGYMDAISMYKASIKNVVACMTSSLNNNQLTKLKKLNVQVRLLLDSDEAGQKGIERNLLPLLKMKIDTMVVLKFDLTTEGKDPDEVLNNKGVEYLQKRVTKLLDPFQFIIFNRLNGKKKISESYEIKELFKDLLPYYQYLDDISKEKNLNALERVTSIKKDDIKSYFTSKEERIITPIKTQQYISRKEYKKKKEREEKKILSDKINVPSLSSITYNLTNDIYSLCLNYNSYPCKIASDDLKIESKILVSITYCYDYYQQLSQIEYEGENFEFSYYPFYMIYNMLYKMYKNSSSKMITKDILDEYIDGLKNDSDHSDDFSDVDLNDNPYSSLVEKLKELSIPVSLVCDILNYLKNIPPINRDSIETKGFIDMIKNVMKNKKLKLVDKKDSKDLTAEDLEKKLQEKRKILKSK